MTPATLKLYEAVDAIDVVREWILEHDEEIRAAEGALPNELAKLLAQAEGDFKTKAERVALFVRELLANVKAVKEEADRLVARARHYERAAEGLKKYLQAQMELADVPIIEGTLCTVRLQKSPPCIVGAPTHEAMATLFASADLQSKSIVLVPASFRFDARAFIDEWKRGAEPPLAGVSVEQRLHVRIV